MNYKTDKRDAIMNFSASDTSKATAYLKEASGLIGLFVTVYLWSLVAMALQT